jgi:hypothetical protein
MNIIEIVHPFPETLLQPLLGNDSLQADSADNEDQASESVCLLLKKRRSTDTCLKRLMLCMAKTSPSVEAAFCIGVLEHKINKFDFVFQGH